MVSFCITYRGKRIYIKHDYMVFSLHHVRSLRLRWSNKTLVFGSKMCGQSLRKDFQNGSKHMYIFPQCVSLTLRKYFYSFRIITTYLTICSYDGHVGVALQCQQRYPKSTCIWP